MIGLIDIDSKIPNLALMKLSSYYKSLGEEVELVSMPGCYTKKVRNLGEVSFIAEAFSLKYEKIFASSVFTRSFDVNTILKNVCGDKLSLGGTGSFEPVQTLNNIIDGLKPDYELYNASEIAKRMKGIGTKDHKLKKALEIVNAGHGFSSRGCIRNCPFCMVPKCEGKFRQVSEIKNLLNDKSNVLVLHDNNLTADPNCIEKLKEIKERNLIVDINQGCDVRLVNEDIARALSEVTHLRSVHYAWDLMGFENQVMDGIKTLSKFIRPYKHMCFMLVGFNTSYEEDVYRMRKLVELGVDPFVMIYNENEKNDIKLKHFARWVNSRIYKSCCFEEYLPWVKCNNDFKQLEFTF